MFEHPNNERHSAAPLRALLTEAAASRRDGDLAAATALENDALRALRAFVVEAQREART